MKKDGDILPNKFDPIDVSGAILRAQGNKSILPNVPIKPPNALVDSQDTHDLKPSDVVTGYGGPLMPESAQSAPPDSAETEIETENDHPGIGESNIVLELRTEASSVAAKIITALYGYSLGLHGQLPPIYTQYHLTLGEGEISQTLAMSPDNNVPPELIDNMVDILDPLLLEQDDVQVEDEVKSIFLKATQNAFRTSTGFRAREIIEHSQIANQPDVDATSTDRALNILAQLVATEDVIVSDLRLTNSDLWAIILRIHWASSYQTNTPEFLLMLGENIRKLRLEYSSSSPKLINIESVMLWAEKLSFQKSE
ncbi:hypothetical protein KBD69_04785 [Candidatus Woesebacteria bacterium]|nr:hypothetical protein [Candidatus Woesebacteria bacterium]